MEFSYLGHSGLRISKLIVGCMSFGKKSWADWVLEDQEEVMKVLKKAYDVGMRTYDTADMYSNGYSEILLGKFIKKYQIDRSKIVILSKVYWTVDTEDWSFRTGLHPYENVESVSYDLSNQGGLSRRHIIDGCQKSVERLGTYIDLYQIHRCDTAVPKEETMRALNDLISQGLVRYIGASSMKAYEFALYQSAAEKLGLQKFVSMQDFYNVLYREEEREMHPYCRETGVGIIPWSPLARGVLTRPLDKQNDTTRAATDARVKILQGAAEGGSGFSEADRTIISRVEELAKKKNCSMAMIAIAWTLAKGVCPILGLSSEKRIEEAVSALQVKLSDEEMKYLEEPYVPKPLWY